MCLQAAFVWKRLSETRDGDREASLCPWSVRHLRRLSLNADQASLSGAHCEVAAPFHSEMEWNHRRGG